MSRKIRIRVVLINIGLFGLLFGLVTLNKEVLRPSLNHLPFMVPFTGSFPNFIAAFIISLCFVSGAIILEPGFSRFLVYLGSLLVFFLLTLEEVRPMWGASTRYDPLDIIATGIGSVLAIVTYEWITRGRKRKSVRTSIES